MCYHVETYVPYYWDVLSKHQKCFKINFRVVFELPRGEVDLSVRCFFVVVIDLASPNSVGGGLGVLNSCPPGRAVITFFCKLLFRHHRVRTPTSKDIPGSCPSSKNFLGITLIFLDEISTPANIILSSFSFSLFSPVHFFMWIGCRFLLFYLFNII